MQKNWVRSIWFSLASPKKVLSYLAQWIELRTFKVAAHAGLFSWMWSTLVNEDPPFPPEELVLADKRGERQGGARIFLV